MIKEDPSSSQGSSHHQHSRKTWIDWESPFLKSWWFDPTRTFAALVLIIMWFRFLEAHEYQFSLLWQGFFINPYVLTFFSLAVLTLYMANHRPTGSSASASSPLTTLPVYDRWALEWYWWNAWLFHMVMDGASGSFRLIPVVVQQYDTLDARFPTGHVVPWIIGVLELFGHGPLCLLTVWALGQGHPSRWVLEIIVSTFQWIGMVIFVLAEVYEEQIHVPALDPLGQPGQPWAGAAWPWDNSYQFIYYWFGFWFCNGIWGVVPLIRLYRAWIECLQALSSVPPKQPVRPHDKNQ